MLGWYKYFLKKIKQKRDSDTISIRFNKLY